MRTWIDETIASSGGAAPCNSTSGRTISSFLVSPLLQLGTQLLFGEFGARGASAHRPVTREARLGSGSASMKTGSSQPLPSATDVRRATSLVLTVPSNMRGATKDCAQAQQVCAFSQCNV